MNIRTSTENIDTNEITQNSADAPESAEMAARSLLQHSKTIVVKIGSALLAGQDNPFALFAEQIAACRARGMRVVVVSSGAIALGYPLLGLSERPREVAALQAAAACGQSALMQRWSDALGKYGLVAAQILLTHADIKDRKRYLNARAAMATLLDAGIVPIVNENDTVAVEEIKFGDNDTLAAQVCGLAGASLVVLLTGAAGLFTSDPNIDPSAKRISVVVRIDENIRRMAGPPAHLGTGGMVTKLDAARIALQHNAMTAIVPGKYPKSLLAILDGEDIGTLFLAGSSIAPARKRWIATALKPNGTLVIDAGAAKALRDHSSLLYAGIRQVKGKFRAGDAVDVVEYAADDEHQPPFARGIVRMDAHDLARVAGYQTAAARALLQTTIPDEPIHRDDLTLL